MDCHISILFPPEKLLHQIIMWTIFYRENLNQHWCVQDLTGESINGDWYPTPDRRCLCMMGLPHIRRQQHWTSAPRTFRTLSRKTCGLSIRLILIALRTFGVYWTARLTKTPSLDYGAVTPKFAAHLEDHTFTTCRFSHTLYAQENSQCYKE